MDEYLKGFDDALGAVPVVSAEYATLEQERDQLKARIAELERKNRLLSQRLFDLDEELLTQLSGWARTKSHDLIVKLLAECRTS